MRFRTIVFAIGCALVPALSSGAEPTLVRVSLPRAADLPLLQRHGFDVVTVHPVDVEGPELAPPAADLVVDRRERALLKRLGFDARALPPATAEDRTPIWAAAGPSLPPGYGQGGMGGAYTLAEIDAVLDHYAVTAPHLVTAKFVIGTSVEGRPIHAVRISDQPGVDEGEPRVLFDALHHAREPMSAHTLLVLIERLVAEYGVDPDVTALVDERDLWIVPVVNPDGYLHNEVQSPAGGGLWRKNRRVLAGGCVGVDLNRNYAYQWGVDDVGSSPDACSAVYRGPAPLSEPESNAVAALVAATGFDVVGSLHAHGRMFLRPFGVVAPTSPQQALYLAHEQRLVAANGYRSGDVLSLVGAANGNALDHHEALHGAEAWGFEVGSSFWPTPAEMVDVALENVEPLLCLVRFAGSWVEPTALIVDDSGGDGDGFADPGETVDVLVPLENLGRHPSGSVTLLATVADATVTAQSASASSGAIGSLASSTAVGLKMAVGTAAIPGVKIPVELRVQFDGLVVTRVLLLDVGTPRAIGREDFETDKGWTAGLPTDTAMTGRWVLADPVGIMQGADVAQPEDDATPTPGTRCYVTGNNGMAAGQDDVDDGFTTLVSPRFDLSGALNPRLRYDRFYWCSKADDPFTVEVSTDDGFAWTPVEVVTGSPNAWTTAELPLAAAGPMTATVRFRFVAVDGTFTSVTEALIDDLEVIDYDTAPHVLVVGRPVRGGSVEVAAAATPGDRVLVLAAAAPSAIPVPGIAGQLGLDPSSLAVLVDATAPPSGLLRFPAIVPGAASLAGKTIWLQSAALAAGGGGAFSNTTSITIE